MAGAGGRRDKSKGKTDKIRISKRAKLIKEANAYWKVLQKKWGAKDLRLRFTTSKRKQYAGGYHQEWYDDPKKPFIEVNIPGTKMFTELSGNSTLKETKKIMRHELAHHRQFLKENVGKEGVGRNPDVHLPTQEEKWHGPSFRKQARQIGGGEQLRPSLGPKNKKRLPRGPGGRPKAKASRKNIARKPPPRTGPPRDKLRPVKRGERLPPRYRQAWKRL